MSDQKEKPIIVAGLLHMYQPVNGYWVEVNKDYVPMTRLGDFNKPKGINRIWKEPIKRRVNGYTKGHHRDGQMVRVSPTNRDNCPYHLLPTVRLHIPGWWQLWRRVQLWRARRHSLATLVLVGGYDPMYGGKKKRKKDRHATVFLEDTKPRMSFDETMETVNEWMDKRRAG